MSGEITKRDLLRHPVLIIQSFGLRVFLRALVARHKTFLQIVMEKP